MRVQWIPVHSEPPRGRLSICILLRVCSDAVYRFSVVAKFL